MSSQDLEDESISRICLALDNIIMTSSADVIPAVQSRLYDLLSHNQSVCITAISYMNHQLKPLYLVHRSAEGHCTLPGVSRTMDRSF